MAERQVENQEPQELNQLENQLQDIQGKFDHLLMAPRQEKEVKKAVNNGSNEGVDDNDELEEIANVADNLDSLNSVLDTIEERADQIRAQLLELLTSNREIRQSLREENEKNQGLCQQSSEQKHDGESDDAESSPAPHQE